MTNNQDIFNILEDLKSMPIFKMSLGSKELFHSNFLEFLWEIDNDMFIRIVNSLLSKSRKKGLVTGLGAPKYELSREKENFDICIYHEEVHGKQTKIVYDLVLENKVKSMPRIDQLYNYYSKVKNSGCRFLLLSLVTRFPDKKAIQKNKWTIVNYFGLKEAIENERMNWPQGKAYGYIEDYCGFIEKLHDLQKAILSGFSKSLLFQDVDLCRNYRLHDLYIKLRCDKFLVELKTRLERRLKALNVNIPIKFISNYNEIKTGNGTQGIYLNTAMNLGEGQAAVFVHLHDNMPVNNYEIVIQGKQYRHGINSKAGTARDKVVAQEQIWKAIGVDNQSFLGFDIFHPSQTDGHAVLPQNCKNVKNCQPRTIPLNGYEKACIYKHVDMVENTKVGVLLKHMAEDVVETIKKFK